MFKDAPGVRPFYRVILLCLSMLPGVVYASNSDFKKALTALEQQQLGEFNRLRLTLAQHPLHGYLDYRFLLKQLDQLPAKSVKPFIAGWGDTPWGVRLQHRWLLKQGQAKNWQAFLQVQPKAPKSTELQCFYYRAQQHSGNEQIAIQGGQQLWLSGKNQPDACTPLFSILKKQNNLSQALIKQRFHLALEANNLTLMRYLHGLSNGQAKKQQQQLITAYQKPSKLSQHPQWVKDPTQHKISLTLLRRWLRKDSQAALNYWEGVQHHFSASDQADFERYSAEYLLARYRTEHPEWIDRALLQYGANHPDLLQLGVRAALAEGDWESVATLSQAADTPYFHYWRLRALEELGRISRKGLHERLSQLTGERSFYSLQAATRTQQPFTLKNLRAPVTPQSYQKVSQLPRIKRVEAFIAEGLVNEARAEWEYLLNRLSKPALAAAAQLAKDNQWAYLGIRNAVKGEFFDDLELRFPLVYSDQIAQVAKKRSMDNSLLFAIARQESAFWPKARSHVGARGLMQLMPSTARETAKRWNIELKQITDLYQPEINLLLGSSYLAGLLKRFDGDTARAAAAYNAGPHRVSRWDKARGDLPIDAWVETIPYRETRNYVQNVLVYQAIYTLRQQQQTQLAQRAKTAADTIQAM